MVYIPFTYTYPIIPCLYLNVIYPTLPYILEKGGRETGIENYDHYQARGLKADEEGLDKKPRNGWVLDRKP